MTSRDEILLDGLRTRAGSLTRTTDLRRSKSYIERIELRQDKLIWIPAKPLVVKDKQYGFQHLLDGSVAREAILTRQRAEHQGRRILDEFVALDDAGDPKILDFAKTWGILDLCWHGVPKQHGSLVGLHLRLPGPLTAWPRKMERYIAEFRCLSVRREPLASWRFFANQAKAILRIAVQLQHGWLGEPKDWSAVLRDDLIPESSIGAHRECLDDVLRDWLTLGRAGLTIDDASHSLRWGASDLFGELAVQLSLAATYSDGRVFCVVCGGSYVPKKQVLRNGANFCPEKRCQAVADAQRAARYRERKADLKESKRSDRKLRFRGLYVGRTDDPFFS